MAKSAYKQENRPEDILLEATSVIYIRRTIPMIYYIREME